LAKFCCKLKRNKISIDRTNDPSPKP
ncbi:unnamed protein product, partial [Brachionus calyciflorus]